jgi:phosphoglycolate phosphatase
LISSINPLIPTTRRDKLNPVHRFRYRAWRSANPAHTLPSGPLVNKKMPFLPQSPIELIHPGFQRGLIRYALFDFDGTLSLIREGWQGIMIPMMVEILMETPCHEPLPALTTLVEELVGRTTGIQTIYQMTQLCAEVRKRGGAPETPQVYKQIYLDRLGTHIQGRLQGLKSGAIQPEEQMVPGALNLLDGLRARGVTCYLASGTDDIFVRSEAAVLGVSSYFAGIYGARDDAKNESKKMVIDRLIAENRLHGPELVTFGDGFVEIEDTKSVGGIAAGVASDEAARQGVDEWKRQRLIRAGADLIVPDYRCSERLLSYLFAEE